MSSSQNPCLQYALKEKSLANSDLGKRRPYLSLKVRAPFLQRGLSRSWRPGPKRGGGGGPGVNQAPSPPSPTICCKTYGFAAMAAVKVSTAAMRLMDCHHRPLGRPAGPWPPCTSTPTLKTKLQDSLLSVHLIRIPLLLGLHRRQGTAAAFTNMYTTSRSLPCLLLVRHAPWSLPKQFSTPLKKSARLSGPP
jgi:hypothetical protein